MKTYIITEESLEAAALEFDRCVQKGCNFAFRQAMKVIAVPQPPEPKPFGPGTKLKAKNGDELVVISNGIDNLNFACVNLTQNQFGPTSSWYRIEELMKKLEANGATIIEED